MSATSRPGTLLLGPLTIVAVSLGLDRDLAAQCTPPCLEGQACVVDQCVWGCGTFAEHHCCYEDHAVACSVSGKFAVFGACGAGGCGWSAEKQLYGCVGHENADPTGMHPKECDFTCVPKCPSGTLCGGDGCGGSCGNCPSGQVCAEGMCCTPHCDGKQCGDDGCGGSCGTCEPGQECLEDRCLWGCNSVPQKGCCHGDSWFRCLYNNVYAAACLASTCGWDKKLQAYECGTDGGVDPTGKYPKECDFACHKTCGTAECGDDGCGGTCGSCGAGEVCFLGKCCTPSCPEGEWACGGDWCGGSCGECPEGFWCTDFKMCAYGYGCEETKAHGCPGCACEDCVCARDEYCCTSDWDWKCTYYCEFECGGCTPCEGSACKPVPEMPDKAEPAAPDQGEDDTVESGETPGPEDLAESPGGPDHSGGEAAPDGGPEGSGQDVTSLPDDVGSAPDGASSDPTEGGLVEISAPGRGGCGATTPGVPAWWAWALVLGLALRRLRPSWRSR